MRISAQTPKPEVEFMRKCNSKKGVLLNATKFFVLALCFTMVFAFALTSGNIGGVASATESEKDGDASFGTANAIFGDNGQLSGVNFGYPGNSASTTTWKFTETYDTIKSSTTNIQVYKETGDTKMFIEEGNTGNWQFGVSNAAKAAQCHGVINFNTAGFIDQMIQNDNVTVTASISFSMGALSSNFNNKFYSVVVGPEILTAEKSYNLREKGGDSNYTYEYKKSSKEATENFTTNTVTLVPGKKNLSLAMGLGWSQRLVPPYTPKRGLSVSNIKVTYTVTFNGGITDGTNLTLFDNASPVVSTNYSLQNDYVKGTSGSGYAPYIPSLDNTADFPVYFDSIKKSLQIDEVSDGAGKLASYTNKVIGQIDSKNYYKYAQTEFVDLYNYSGMSFAEAVTTLGADAAKYIGAGDRILSGVNAETGALSWTNTTSDTHLKYASGIKTVQINETTFNIYDGSDIGKTKQITDEDEQGNVVTIGYAQITKTNRDRVVVKLYFVANGTVQTTVTDFGGENVKTRLQVSGIDYTAPDNSVNSGTSIDGSDFLKSSADALAWLRQSKLSADASIRINEDGAGVSPYLWFYTVNRANSLEMLNLTSIEQFASFADIKAAGIKPIALGEISSFNFDFSTGMAKSYGSSSYDQGNPSYMEGDVTGHGYYRFTFYIFDLAGNKGGEQTFYAKVDYDTPTYNLDLSYINKKNENVTISADQNGAWATGKTTLKLTLTGGGFSGYTLVFEDASAVHTLVVDGAGEFEGANYVGKLVKYHSTNLAAAQADGNSIVIPIESNLQKTTATVTYEVVDGKGVFTFVIDTTANVAWISTFTTYAGQYDSAEVVEQQDVAVSYFRTDWKGGVKVLIDANAPQNPLLSDSEDALDAYLNALGGNYENLPLRRTWYTSAYATYGVDLAFSDDIVNSDYASGINVFYGMKVVKTLAELQALGALDIESKYVDFTATSDLRAYFDRVVTIQGTQLDGDQTALTLDLITAQTAGMRIIYVWAVDQAGNVSRLNVYYVLADANDYSVSSAVKNNSALGNTATITQTDADGNLATQFKRGETVYFNIAIDNGYVPFRFVKNDANSTVLLENYLQNKRFALANEDFADYIKFSATDVSSVQYVMDDPSSLGNLATTAFELSHRKVVSYTVTNTSVAYSAKETVVPTSFTDEKSKASFVYRFVDNEGNVLYLKEDGTTTALAEEAKLGADGKPVYFVPVKPGNYKVNIYIPKDNDTYVTDDFAMDESGNQTFSSIDYSIIKGRAVISAKATTSAYGAKIVLEYDVDGIAREDMESEGISVALALAIDGFDPSAVYSIGSYTIVNNVSYDEVENYTVTYESNVHVITARQITVYTWKNSKVYGDSDPEFAFGVGENQFAYTTISVGDVLAEIFGAGYEQTGVETLDGENFYLYKAGDRISRQSGESVGEYEFNADSALFDVNSNYAITIQNNQHFNITQRTVVIDASGQFSVLPFGSTPDPTAILPTYTIGAVDMHLAEQIAALVDGKLSLDANGTEVTVEGYSKAIKYAVLLAAAQNANIKVVLGENAEYFIYVTEQNAVVVKVKDGVKFEFVYGIEWNNATAIAFDATKFDVTGKNEGEYDNITWTATISAGETLVNAGSYVVKFENAKLVKDGVELEDSVFVESTTAVVNPAQIVVNPTSTATQKTYGEPESVFGIDFGVVSVNGDTSGTYAGKTFEEIKQILSGTFARARYAKNGDLRWLGSRYDDVTDKNGVIALASADGDYYGYAVNSAFASSDKNFAVVAQFDKDARFVINAKAIELHTKDFVGVNKVYDGTTAVNYGTTKVYDLSSMLAIASDDVYLAVGARYNKVGSPSKKESANIIFDSVYLAGDKAHNYVITLVVNDAVGALVNGESSGSNYVYADVTEIEIVSVNGTSELIYIVNGIVGVLKNDFTISKQYDKTTDLSVGNVKVAETQNEQGIGTKMLAGAKARLIEMESGKFSDVNVSANYVVNVTLFFEFGDDTDNIDIVTSGIYDQPDVQVTRDVIDGVKGIKVKLSNMSASIVKRILGADSFETISAVDRDYNATDIVQMNYTFKEGALVEGDTSASVGLKLMGVSASKNAGNHNVTVAALANVNNSVNTFVSDTNYTVDVDSINAYYGTRNVKVTIARAQLMPNVTFVQKEYDDTTSVTVTKNSGNDFTTAQYSVNLASELQRFSLGTGKVSYELSRNGKPDANVTENEMHNVLVGGLEVVVESGYESLLANYQIYGSRYNASEGYNTVGSVTSGVIEDYEIIDAVKVTKKVISLVENDFDIKDKVYDGTTSADISIVLSSDRVVGGHEDHLEVVASGTFARKQVGNNIKVIINEVKLKALDANGENVIGNYTLKQYTGSTSANIVERPVVVSADLGSRVYNGSPNVSKGNITYTFDGIIPGEIDNYAIQTRDGAYFFDKNVNVERNAEGEVNYDANGNATVLDKDGIAYNPVLTNKKERYINYVLVYGVNNIISGKTCLAYDDENGERHFGAPASGEKVSTYYYALETAQKYVLVSDAANYESAKSANALIGYYLVNGQHSAYFVANDYDGTISGTTATPVPYINGKGRIEQRSVYIAANGIKKVDGTKAFEKEYDGTTKFYGTLQGSDPSETDAFYYDASSVANLIGDDQVTIKNISAQFDKANTDALYVVFSVSGIQGKDAYNYTIKGDKTVTVNLSAKITKRTIKASLADGETVYGTSLSNVGGKIEYSIAGYPLTLEGNSFYMNFKKYLVAVGFLADETATVSADDEAFVKQLYGNTYNLLDGQFVKAGDGEVGEYIRLGGTQNDAITTLPKPKAVFSTTKPTNGTVALSYTLASSNAKNFAFESEYTGNSPDGNSSRLTVVKKDLYVVTVGIAYSKIYGSSDPVVELRYLGADGQNGIVSSETWMSIFKNGSVDYRPVVKLAIYNSATGEITDADEYALISRRPAGDTTSRMLGANEYYVYYLAAPDGVDYSAIVENYNVILGAKSDVKGNAVLDTEGNPTTDEDGKVVMSFVYDFAGVVVTSKASTLEITLPTLTGISVASTENTFVYTVDKNDKEKRGINRVYDVLQGETDEDIVKYFTFVDGQEVESEARDAGVHEGVIKVKRFVKVNDSDPNGYFVVWTSGETEVKITIEKASVSLKANKMSEYYNGKEHVYVTSGKNNKITSTVALGDKDVKVSYELYDGEGYTSVNSVVNAGTYRVTLSLSDEFLKLHPNYKPETVQTTLTVIRAIVNVTIDSQGYESTSELQNGTKVTKISAPYDKERTYDVSYTVEMDQRSDDPSIALDVDSTKLVWNKTIASPGRYAFSIVLDDEDKLASNYNFVGASGILELTATSLDAGDNQVKFVDGGIVANRLVVKEIKTDSVLASDMSYLEAIEQYVSILSRQAGLKDDAQVAAVLRIGFYLDDQLVNVLGTPTTVSVALPSQVKNMKGIAIYTVTEQGGLKKLTDYAIENGKLTYTADYVSGIVFVDVNPQTIEPWKVATIVCVVLAVVIIVTVCVVGTIIRKRQLKNS